MEDKMDMPGMPGDVVELIIAVDLNPSDPTEPINVKNVDVREPGHGGEGGEDWRDLCVQMLMGDPNSGVTSDSISYDEAVDAVARVLGDGAPEGEPEDPFTKAMKPKAPKAGPKPPGGGMKAALDKALGRPGKPEDDEDEEEL